MEEYLKGLFLQHLKLDLFLSNLFFLFHNMVMLMRRHFVAKPILHPIINYLQSNLRVGLDAAACSIGMDAMEAKKQEQPTGSSSKPAGKKRKKQIKKENDKLKTGKGSN